MAIIIPSKNIFSKSFDPVVDNNIDKVEVELNEPQIVNDTENVYNETVSGGFYSIGLQKSAPVSASTYITGLDMYSVAVAYIEEKPTYRDATFTIPRNMESSYLVRVLTGTDKSDNSQIKLSMRGSISKGTAHGSATVGFATFAVSNLVVSTPTNVTTEDEAGYILTDSEIDSTYSYSYTYAGKTATATKNFSLTNMSNILDAQATLSEDGKSFNISLTLLSGLEITKLGGGIAIRKEDLPITLTGEYQNYVPTSVEVSFYGDTISLDLQDKTVKIGDGNKVFSFDGNELIQTTNTPSAETRYQGIVNEWKNGKQTAVISCPIADYYDENGNTAINSTGIVYVKLLSKSGNDLNFQEIGTKNMKVGQTVIRAGDRGILINVTQVFSDYSFSATFVSGSSALLVVGANYTTTRFINMAKMTFHEGDIVIPHIYTNKGDKPMSYNKDFTPKQFKVVGTRISQSQGGTQELTLQEV